jgi:hypothetical protein
MATTSYPVNDALAVKAWSKRLGVEALKETTFRRFMKEDANSLVQEKSETRKGRGDAVTAVHEVERIYEPGDPQDGHGDRCRPGQPQCPQRSDIEHTDAIDRERQNRRGSEMDGEPCGGRKGSRSWSGVSRPRCTVVVFCTLTHQAQVCQYIVS